MYCRHLDVCGHSCRKSQRSKEHAGPSHLYPKSLTTFQVINSTNLRSQRAAVESTVAAPDVVRTGIKSKAELRASDQTITRIGSNTVLSFDRGKRGINLEQGSVLFHSPRGRGGGVIRTAGATAAITGTTVAISATSNGGFKCMTLEGSAKATLPNGRSRTLKAGQLTFILPGSRNIPKPINFDLQRNVNNAGS